MKIIAHWEEKLKIKLDSVLKILLIKLPKLLKYVYINLQSYRKPI